MSETGKWFRIGLLWFKVRHLTLAQIHDMGKYIEGLHAECLDGKRLRVYAEVFARYDDARLMQDICISCIFRSQWMRFLFGWYIRRKLTLTKYQELLEYVLEGLDANFFLTSIISLKRTAKLTEPS